VDPHRGAADDLGGDGPCSTITPSSIVAPGRAGGLGGADGGVDVLAGGVGDLGGLLARSRVVDGPGAFGRGGDDLAVDPVVISVVMLIPFRRQEPATAGAGWLACARGWSRAWPYPGQQPRGPV
jgi:hypothetical protein